MDRRRGRRPFVVLVIATRIKGSTRYRVCECCNKCGAGSDTYEREHHDCAKECLCDCCGLEIGFNESSLRKEKIAHYEGESFI